MTISQMCEIVGTLLGYSGTDKRAHSYDVFIVGDMLRSAKIADYAREHGDDTLGQFCLPIIFDVQFDTIRNRYFIDLETQVIGLDNNKGIIQVTLPQEEYASFIVRSSGMTAVVANLVSGLWNKTKKCWIEGLKIYFEALDPQQTQIMVKAIPSLFYWVRESGEDLIFFDSQLPQPADFSAGLVEGARAWFVEQKYYGDYRQNLGMEPKQQQPRQILQSSLPQGQGGIGATL